MALEFDGKLWMDLKAFPPPTQHSLQFLPCRSLPCMCRLQCRFCAALTEPDIQHALNYVACLEILEVNCTKKLVLATFLNSCVHSFVHLFQQSVIQSITELIYLAAFPEALDRTHVGRTYMGIQVLCWFHAGMLGGYIIPSR